VKLTAKAIRSEGWWAVEVPEIKGLFTQARRLDQVKAMVLDAASLLTDRPESDFEVALEVDLPGHVGDWVESVHRYAETAREAQAEASHLARKAAHELAVEGLPLRDIGSILDVSHQRVGQLLAGFKDLKIEEPRGIPAWTKQESEDVHHATNG
jgi:DNA-directed RNA polymerase specialized sigma24 family protein